MTSNSSEQGLAEVPHTDVNGSSTNSAFAPPNHPHITQMEALDQVPQQFHAQYTTELK